MDKPRFSASFPKPSINPEHFSSAQAALRHKKRLDKAIDKYQGKIETLPDTIELNYRQTSLGSSVIIKHDGKPVAEYPCKDGQAKKAVKGAIRYAWEYLRQQRFLRQLEQAHRSQ